ncbi:MAG: peptide chain release factor N(5)-glutamine methyltransferase [Candidatus Latescibacterota bacterium]
MSEKPERVIDLITVAAEHMKSRGFENARLEVERLLGSVLGLSRIELYLAFDRPVSEEDRERFRALYRRRLAHEPLQHLLGETDFREVTLKTDRRALIPRPETELLVEIAVEFLKGRDHPLVADLGTGTGAIALSVAYEAPGTHVVAVDISDDALLLADRNAREMGVSEAITLVSGNMLAALEGRERFDAILSNPPYIRTMDIESLQPEVRNHEPKIALDGGPDGMEFLRAIIAGAHRFLKPGGLLLLECGEGQGEMLKRFADETNRYHSVEVIHDLAGKDRVIKAVKKE